jgi:transcriptional regulator with XRE-family HTH domain
MTTCHYIRTIISNIQELKKELQKAIANVVRKNRTKSITKSADEIGMGKSMWADLENGIKDPQVSTLWRIAEGLDIKPHELVKMIEDELREDFSFLENSNI